MYAELHCHSNYSFQEGASSVEELLVRAMDLGYPALALTDHDNLCGAMEFSRMANDIGIQPITGAEITLEDGSHLTLLSKTRKGYSNLCNLITHSRFHKNSTNPKVDLDFLKNHTEGITLLTGCARGKIPALATERRDKAAEKEIAKYLEWFGTNNVFVELQQNMIYGDVYRNKLLVKLAKKYGLNCVATNNVHYHIPERHQLQDALVAIRHNLTLEESHLERRANNNFYLKPVAEITSLFSELPEALSNTIKIAEQCTFNLKEDLGYELPSYPVSKNHTPLSYLKKICYQAAVRKYGSINAQVLTRLEEEFHLLQLYNLSGFFLIYYEIIQLARQAMIDLGISSSEIPLEERPPGRGRGSSVASLVAYLIGLSHIDPLAYNLSLGRFLNNDMSSLPDIDLDFPRNIREELIRRIHDKYGWDHAVITGSIATYKMKGCIKDIGKILGLPSKDLHNLSRQIDTRHSKDIESEMARLPSFREKINHPYWQIFMKLTSDLHGAPKYLSQHPGGMIISSSPLTDMVPVQPSTDGERYICHWDKDSIADAGFVKIDFLALGTLSQLHESLQLIENRTGKSIDISRINFDDQEVYKSIHKADTIGVFQIESAAQMQTVTRLKPKNLREMAYEVACVRPGVGNVNGVSQFISRYVNADKWEYDHPLEKPALERTHGVILYQDQVNELAMNVAGFQPREADHLRRAFGRKNGQSLIKKYWSQFKTGAIKRGVSESIALKIFNKFSGQYMFPESHAYAFGITAYQMSWIKHYYPLEFFIAIFNQQPMGFYNLETLKEDAKRHGIYPLNIDINKSLVECAPKDNNSFLLGLSMTKGISNTNAGHIVRNRDSEGPFLSITDTVNRLNLNYLALKNLARAGAFDTFTPNRRSALWEIGLIYRPASIQLSLPLSIEQDRVTLPNMSDWEKMAGEYDTTNLYPQGHLMEILRPNMSAKILTSAEIPKVPNHSKVTVAGLVIRRQHPRSHKIFLTLEDEYGHISIIVLPKVFNRYRNVLSQPVLKIIGTVSKTQDNVNIVASIIENIYVDDPLPPAKNWE